MLVRVNACQNFQRVVLPVLTTCHRDELQQATKLIMGEVPSTRVQTSRLYLTAGVDYAGLIPLRFGPPRSKTITKVYFEILVCFMTTAVHIEVVTRLTTEAFHAALRCFIARRGKPRNISSDNGTNYQGADNERQ